MNRKWLPGLVALTVLTVLMAAIGGSTFAIFTSQASNDDNTFVTQQFNRFIIERDDGDSPPEGPMFYTMSTLPTEINPDGYWQPGMTVRKTMIMRNLNGLNIHADGIRLQIHGLAGVPPAIRDDLLQHMRITMTNSSGTLMLINDKTLYEISDLALGGGFQPFDNPVPIMAGAYHPARVTITFVDHPHDDGHLMGLSGPSALLVDFVVHATQIP